MSWRDFKTMRWILLIFLIVLVIGYAVYVIIYSKDSFVSDDNQSRKVDDLFSSDKVVDLQGRVIEQPKFGQEYVLPDDVSKQDNPGSIYGSEVQIRGQIKSISKTELTIQSVEESFAMKLANKVMVSCLPEVLVTGDGKEIDAKNVYVDLSRMSESNRNEFLASELEQYFEPGDEVTVLALVGEADVLTVKSLAGYGCDIARTLELSL